MPSILTIRPFVVCLDERIGKQVGDGDLIQTQTRGMYFESRIGPTAGIILFITQMISKTCTWFLIDQNKPHNTQLSLCQIFHVLLLKELLGDKIHS